MDQVFTNRWSDFHTPDMTVDFKLHPEFGRHDTDKGTDKDSRKFHEVIKDLVKTPGTPSVTIMKFHYEEMRIVLKTGSHPPSSNIRYERS
jgi:hypothetical protein